MPHDLFFGDVYIPPLLIAAVLALVTTSLLQRVLTHHGIMKYFANAPLVFLSISAIFTVIFSSTLFPS